MLVAAAVVAGAIGAYAGWRIGGSALPTNPELRSAAAGLVPAGLRLEGVSLVDRRPSFSRPLWDVAGSRYAQADLRAPATADPAAIRGAIARKAREDGWRVAAGAYERDAMRATVEITELGPAADDVAVTIRVRPHSRRPQLGLALGFAAGVLAVLLVALAAL